MRISLLYIAVGLLFWSCTDGEVKALGEGSSFHVGSGYSRRFQLPDGTKAVLSPGTSISVAKGFGRDNRDVELDGEAMFDVIDTGSKPFVVHTRDLVIGVVAAPARFHVEADRSRAGEQADLLGGKLRVSKSYHSDTDNEPESLAGGEMIMINRDIDLMEKEKLSAAEIQKLKVRP